MATRARTVTTAVNAAIRAARDAGRIHPHHEPAVAIAVKLAKALTPADLSSTELVRLSGELDKQLSRLPLAPEQPPKRGDEGDGARPAAGGAGEAGSHSPGLAVVVGSGPTLGDTALPR